jgi:hypothetical protein
MDLKTQMTTLFNDIKDIAKIVAPIMAFVGIIGAGIIYTGAALPIVSTWKRNNPDLMNSIFTGMLVLVAAGTISGLIAYA